MVARTVPNSVAAIRAVVTSLAKKIFVVAPTANAGTGADSLQVEYARADRDPLGDVIDWLDENPEFAEQLAVFIPIDTLFQGLSHFRSLQTRPIVFHAEVGDDYGYVTALRHSGFVFLQSFGPEDAPDIAVAAHLTAVMLQKPVVHFYHNTQRPAPFNWTTETIGAALARSILVPEKIEDAEAKQEAAIETASNGSSDHSNGHSNGHANGNGTNGTNAADGANGANGINGTNGNSGANGISSGTATEESADATTEVGKITSEEAVKRAFSIVGDNLSFYEYRGPQDAKTVLVVFGAGEDLARAAAETWSTSHKVGTLFVRLYSPLQVDELLTALPTSVRSLALLEQIATPTTTWLPLVQDVLTGSPELLSKLDSFASYQLGLVTESNASQVLSQVQKNQLEKLPKQGLLVGEPITEAPVLSAQALQEIEAAQKLESAYLKVLYQLFPHAFILNAADKPTAGIETSPEFGFGAFLANESTLSEQLSVIKSEAAAKKYSPDLNHALSKWFSGDHSASIVKQIETIAKSDAKASQLNTAAFTPRSNWLVGSDAWSYDLGNSGVHHVLSSGKNLNMLVIDSTPQSKLKTSRQRKKDLGLYAMGFGNVYVASVAVYASYTQLLQAFIEAEKFNGPSVVVAYLPYYNASDDAITVLKETKQAVDTGYWPLYRYNPTVDGEDSFVLDSFTIRKTLRDFLDRENKLTVLSRKSPAFARDLKASYGSEVRSVQAKKARDAYAKLLEGLSGPPVLILFASDGGQAESVSRRLARRAKGRGVKATVMAFDDFEADDLSREPNVIFITSTAGQGEFPQNGRALWDAIKSTELDLTTVKVGVFGMGDSQYWPRKQDKHYYNKPCHDLWSRVKLLGAQELVPLGEGDDQDADGWSTGYNAWEPEVWKALGVDNIAGADEPAPITNEDMKRESNYLRGTIAEGLLDKSTGSVSAVDQQLTKFHGIYMQDDRDVREQRKADGLEPAYIFMARVRLPGCIATPDQWLRIDELSDERGNGTFKITTRGTFQLHGLIKENLKPAIRGINAALLDTVAACGDVDRNVVASALPSNAAVHHQIAKAAQDLSEHLLPRTSAYYEIWLEGEDAGDKAGYADAWNNREGAFTKKTKTLVGQSNFEDHEPLYGQLYLPRKFKINIAVPPYNDVDVYAHDIGLIAIVENDRDVVGFNVCVGGGMGTTHNNKKTYPRMGSLIGFAPLDKILDVCEKVMLVQRDNGDRTNRKHARLKYTVDDMTVKGFKAEVEKYLGYPLDPAREHVPFKTNVDTYGWIEDETGYSHFTTFVENGRVEDTPELQFRTGFREIAKLLKGGKGEFRLTANQHILVANVSPEEKPKVHALLEKYKLDNVQFSGLRLSSAACVAFPTCGLAMAESERYLPELITKVEGILEELGLRKDAIVMRMTGCPNGCARPWLAEVALVGKAYGAYNLMLGGGHVGNRLNKLYRSSLKEDEILDTLRPMFKSWALERTEGEPFGDFVVRKGIISAVREGKDWWENVEPGLE